ncbi:MAG TPA: type II toxin-antitoxin system CcdA family antitoxin [Gammaproteobacteria bacterium]|nr:type II toxin-antitoxin system CcdA family antitoxin [Gammaproteobacteria bacterium]
MPAYDVTARKKPVNLTLNEDLVARTRAVTDNLSAVVEALLAEYLSEEQRRRADKADAVRKTVAEWNRFNAAHGSLADDHSTL